MMSYYGNDIKRDRIENNNIMVDVDILIWDVFIYTCCLSNILSLLHESWHHSMVKSFFSLFFIPAINEILYSRIFCIFYSKWNLHILCRHEFWSCYIAYWSILKTCTRTKLDLIPCVQTGVGDCVESCAKLDSTAQKILEISGERMKVCFDSKRALFYYDLTAHGTQMVFSRITIGDAIWIY